MTTGDAPATIEQAEFKAALGHFASGVVVVTGGAEDDPSGLTCQSFIALSLDPPLVAFAPATTSTSWPAIRDGGSCTVNVLSSSQESLAMIFARSGADKFSGVGWTRGATGAPRLHDALVWLDCDHEQIVDAGDHSLVMARVVALETNSGEPLLFYRGGFGAFRP